MKNPQFYDIFNIIIYQYTFNNRIEWRRSEVFSTKTCLTGKTQISSIFFYYLKEENTLVQISIFVIIIIEAKICIRINHNICYFSNVFSSTV